MPSGKVVFTGNLNVGQAVTARNFANLANVNFDFVHQVVTMTYIDGSIPMQQVALDYSTIATFTAAIAAGVTTMTLS